MNKWSKKKLQGLVQNHSLNSLKRVEMDQYILSELLYIIMSLLNYLNCLCLRFMALQAGPSLTTYSNVWLKKLFLFLVVRKCIIYNLYYKVRLLNLFQSLGSMMTIIQLHRTYWIAIMTINQESNNTHSQNILVLYNIYAETSES